MHWIKKDKQRWNRKFAWLPVRIEYAYIWLEFYSERWRFSEFKIGFTVHHMEREWNGITYQYDRFSFP